MNLKDECYTLCKELKKNSLFTSARDLIRQLNCTEENKLFTPLDRSQFGYIATRQYSQFMGYLIVDEKREELEKTGHFKVPELRSDEKELLKKLHYIIKYIDKSIISLTTVKYPILDIVLNPYSQFPYPDYLMDINEIINPIVYTPIIESFKESVVIKSILETPENVVPSSDILSKVLYFTHKVEKHGVHLAPEDFNKAALTIIKFSNQYYSLRLLFLCMSIRKIIRNINQLLFQAFINDKLSVFDVENTINILKNSSHVVGRGLTVFIQPNGETFLCQPGDIVLIKNNIDDLNNLCVINNVHTSYLSEFGASQKFDLRLLDNNLNPFFGLLNI